MKILGLETAAKTASVALWEEDRLLYESFLDAGFTHSETVLPMTHAALEHLRLTPADVDLFAVACGPGSFTGLRIGIAAVKALAFALEKPCAPVSTLEALAMALDGAAPGALVCPAMDARCGQVYTALFVSEETGLRRLWPDRAISLAQLHEELCALRNQTEYAGKTVFLLGDGSVLCYTGFEEDFCRLAPAHLRFGHAAGVCRAAARLAREGKTVPADELSPRYLRLPQAEREKQKREGNST